MIDTRLLRAIGGVDDDLIERASQKNDTTKHVNIKRSPWLRWAVPAAACFAAVAIALPTMLNSNAPNNPDNPGVISSESPHTQSGEQPSVVPPTSSEPKPAPSEIWPLTLNKASQTGSERVRIEGHFWYDLTDEQQNAVFPNLSLALIATAHYRGDGSLYNVVAYEKSADGSQAMYAEYYNSVMIEIFGEGGGSMGCVAYPSGEQVVTNICGVPVIACVVDFNSTDGIALYSATFELDGKTYNIELYDSNTGNAGRERLSLIVNEIINRGDGVADLGVLENPVIP